MEAAEGGDVLLVNGNMVPITEVVKKGGDNFEE